jgi:hypothetical protein
VTSLKQVKPLLTFAETTRADNQTSCNMKTQSLRLSLINILLVFFLFSFSNGFSQYIRGPQSISISGGGTFCLNESTTIAASVTTGHLCGSGASTQIAYTIKIYSNTTNTTTGGALVQTCSIAAGTGNATCSYVAPNSTAGTLYYYATAEWGSNGCTSGDIITSSTTTVVVQSTCVTCSSLLVYNDQYGNYRSHDSKAISTYASKMRFNNPSGCADEEWIRTRYCNNDYGYAQACSDFNNTTANVSSTSQPWYYFDFTPSSTNVEICGIEIFIWGYGNSSGSNKAARDVQIGYSIGGGAWITSSFGMVSDNNDCETTHTPCGRKVTWTFPANIKTTSNIRVRVQPYNGNAATNTSYEIDFFQAAILGYNPTPLSSATLKLEGFTEKGSNLSTGLFKVLLTLSSHFIVQKSSDGEILTPLSEVHAKENVSRYTQTDKLPSSINYYKIIAVDFNGNIISSNTVVLKQKKGSFAVNSIYPNPANDVLNINLVIEDRQENVQIRLVNTIGAIVYEQTLSSSSNLVLDVSSFAGGVYYVMLTSSKDVFKERIVISKP